MIPKESLKHLSADREILMREEDFAYLLPCRQLKHLISNFTLTFPNESTISDGYTVMPHGSVTLVLFYYRSQFHSFLFGPTTKPQKVGDIANQCEVIFIIEFQPAGFYPFTQLNQKELTNKIIPFSSIAPSLDTVMQHIFTFSISADELLVKCEEQFIQNIRFPYPKELSLALDFIVHAEGIATSTEISNTTFYTPRHLNRLFNQYLGMSMKAFSRLVRINKSISLINEKPVSLTLVYEKMGYYDVSHFVKDFKMVCGITPQEYRTHMSDYYSEIAKF